MKNLINKILFLICVLAISISVFPQSKKIEQKTVVKFLKKPNNRVLPLKVLKPTLNYLNRSVNIETTFNC